VRRASARKDIQEVVARCPLAIALFFASELSAAAQQQAVRGVVRDPHGRGVAGAEVVLSCADGTNRVRTADDGVFSFGVTDGSACDLTVRRAGFAEWRHTVRALPAPLTVTLTIAPLRETVNVAATPLDNWDLSSAGSSSQRSAADLRPLGSDSRVWLDLMLNDAGAFVGQRRIYVDGLPADAAPDAPRIGSIAVNADPFSAEYGGTDQNRVDITTATPDRHWRFNAGGPSWIQGGSDPLVARPAPDRRQRFAGMSGPVPHLPITFFVQGSTFGSTEYPTYVAVQPAGGSLDAVAVASTLAAWSFGARVTRSGFAWHSAIDSSETRLENAGVGGLTAPNAGLQSVVRTRRMLSSWTTTGHAVRHRGGLLIVSNSTDSSAIATGQARTVFGQVNTSGADMLADATSATRLYMRHAMDGLKNGRPWSAGIELSRSVLHDSPVPNPFGRLELETADASSGTLIVQRGMPALRATDTASAIFLQATPIERQHVLLRTGARGDWQSGEGLLLSPRTTLQMRGRGFIAAARAGLFVEPWSPALLLEARRRDPIGLETLVIRDVMAGGDPAAAPAGGERLSARFAPAASRRRDVVIETLIARGFGRAAASVDHKWTRGIALAGATRSRTPDGLVDVIDSDRGLTRHQLHLRVAVTAAAATVTAHYEFAPSFDDTDEALSLPARQGDVAGEWARSTGIAGHHASLVASLTLPGTVRAFVSASASSGSPYSLVTGRDVERLAVFTDRGGAPRNSLIGPSQRSVSVYASRRIEVARARGLAFDVGVRAENVFDWTNVTAVGAVAGSGWSGLPLTALAGRMFNVWASIAR
jgi:hypothetical protein